MTTSPRRPDLGPRSQANPEARPKRQPRPQAQYQERSLGPSKLQYRLTAPSMPMSAPQRRAEPRSNQVLELPPLQRLLTVIEIAELLAVSPRTIHRLVKSGDLRPIRVGRQLRFTQDDIRRLELGSIEE